MSRRRDDVELPQLFYPHFAVDCQMSCRLLHSIGCARSPAAHREQAWVNSHHPLWEAVDSIHLLLKREAFSSCTYMPDHFSCTAQNNLSSKAPCAFGVERAWLQKRKEKGSWKRAGWHSIWHATKDFWKYNVTKNNVLLWNVSRQLNCTVR